MIPHQPKHMPLSTATLSPDDLTEVPEPPLLADAIRAYRCWAVDDDETLGLILRSLTYRVAWHPRRELIARCLRKEQPAPSASPSVFAKYLFKTTRGHPAPDLHHRCGIYSLKKLEDCRSWTSSYSTSYVIGVVLIWGKVFEHDIGYLSEFAYPLSLVELGPDRGWENSQLDPLEVLPVIASRYGIADEVAL